MKRIGVKKVLVLVWFIGFIIGASLFGADDIKIVDMRCEYLKNPLGIDVLEPRLSWILESPQRSQMQAAYRILVASSAEKLKNDKGDLWDSGRVVSDQSTHIVYRGKALQSRMRCYWKVMAWGKEGTPSAWSEPAMWSVGLLSRLDWRADWIGTEPSKIKGVMVSGFLARPSARADDAKWVQVDLGASRRFNTIKLSPAFSYDYQSKSIVPGYAFPVRFRIDTSDDANFETFTTIADHSQKDYPNPGRKPALFKKKDAKGRFVRITSLQHFNRRETEMPFMFGLSEMEVLDGKQNLAYQRAVLSSDGIKGYGWNDKHLTDGITLVDANLPPDHPDLNRSRLPARYLRREFHIQQKVKRATAYVCGLGFFEFYLNGNKVSDHCMDPALTTYQERSFYVTFDLTENLVSGDNALGIILGNGRYYGPRYWAPGNPEIYGFPKLLFRMEIEYQDGSRLDIVSDSQWRMTTQGPIRANNEFDGEEYDARMEIPGWSKTGYDDSDWESAVRVRGPGGLIQAQMLEPMRVTEVLKPVAITEIKPGLYMVDMGQVFYGTVRLKVKGPAGTKVKMRSAYSLRPDGSLIVETNRTALITDVYILKGEGLEVWNPRFRGQGYRFVEVTGFPGKPSLDNFEGLVVHTDFETAGQFTCSNNLINKIYTNIRWGQRTYYRSVPMEPDREERQGWMGNQARDFESCAYNFYMPSMLTKWLGDIRHDQLADGHVPSISPTFWANYSSGIVWPSNIVILPDLGYDFYGDVRFLEENYESMKRWILFISRHLKPDYTVDHNRYADWCDAYSMDGNPNRGGTPGAFVSSAYFYHDCKIMERAAFLLGRGEDAYRFGELAEKIKTGFNERFFNPENNTYVNGTQTSYVLPLTFGLADPERREALVSNLVNDIMVNHDGHLSVGLIGIIWLMQLLSDEGHPDVAYTIATQTTRPSWGYMISKGATTIWERWDGDTRDPKMNSEALLILAGNVEAWLYQTLAGIDYDIDAPGFRRIRMYPYPVGDLTHVKALHRSLYGKIESEWKIEEGKFLWNVTVPVNTTAMLYIPASSAEDITEQGLPVKESEGVRFLGIQKNRAFLYVGSGNYSFISKSVPSK